MKWNNWVSILFPVLLKILGALVPAIGGALGGPIGWIVTFLLSKGVSMLADMAERLARFNKISAEVLAEVNALKATSDAFFQIEDKRERGEPVDAAEREAAKKAMKEAAKKLINLKKKEAEPEEEEEEEENEK